MTTQQPLTARLHPNLGSGASTSLYEAPSPMHLRFREGEQVEIQLPRFCVFDGSSRVVIEVQNEEDARYLCREMGWELICAES